MEKVPEAPEPEPKLERIRFAWSLGNNPAWYERTIALAREMGCNGLQLFTPEMDGHVPSDMVFGTEMQTGTYGADYYLRHLERLKGDPRLRWVAIDVEHIKDRPPEPEVQGAIMAKVREINTGGANVLIAMGNNTSVRYPDADLFLGYHSVSHVNDMGEDATWPRCLRDSVAPDGQLYGISPQVAINHDTPGDPHEIGVAMSILGDLRFQPLWGIERLVRMESSLRIEAIITAVRTAKPSPVKWLDRPALMLPWALGYDRSNHSAILKAQRRACRIAYHAEARVIFVNAPYDVDSPDLMAVVDYPDLMAMCLAAVTEDDWHEYNGLSGIWNDQGSKKRVEGVDYQLAVRVWEMRFGSALAAVL